MVGPRIPCQDYSEYFIIPFASAGTVCSSMGDVLSPTASARQLWHGITAKCEITTYFHLLGYHYKSIRTEQKVD